MKKKAIKIAASTAVAASAFVAAAPAHQADAATNVNQLVTDAQNAGTVLKWAISVEGTADFVTRPYNQYNAAKKAVAAAEAAAKGLSTSEKLSVDAKLVDAKLQVKRAEAYIDAITSSEKIKDLTSKLNAAIATGDIEKVESAYHTASAEYRKQAKLLDRVYGQSTRDEIRNAVKPAIEKAVASVKNEVTVNMLVKAADADAKAGKIVEANAKLAEAQAILDANVLKWETALQKSLEDVKATVPALPGNIGLETAAFHGEVGHSYPVVATFKTASGAAYNGPVDISFTKNDFTYKVLTGVVATGDTVYPVNGQIVLTVSATTATADGKVKFVNQLTNEEKYSGTLNFYTPATTGPLLSANGVVKYVDAANNYFVTKDLKKYVLKATGNLYQDTNNALLTLDAFKAKLSAGDTVSGDYSTTSGSNFKLEIDYVAQADFYLDQLDQLVTKELRVEGNSTTLTGTGDAGKLVLIYNGNIGGKPVAQARVGSNGTWSASVAVKDATTFAVRNWLRVNEIAPEYDALEEESDDYLLLPVVPGKFTAVPGTLTGSTSSLLNESVEFVADLTADKNNAKVASNAQITLLDGDLTRATFVNGVNGTEIKKSAEGFTIKFGAPSTISGGDNKLSGALAVNSVTGVTNAYGFKVNVSGTITSK